MDSESTRADVEAQLRKTAEAMSERMASLQEEVSTSGTSLRNWMVRNPWKSVGGMLAAGMAVGMLFGSGRSRRRAHTELVDKYIDILRNEVDDAVAAGEEPGQALERALRDRIPLVVYSNEQEGGRQRGFVGTLMKEGVEIVLSTVFGLMARDAIEALLADVDVEELMDEDMLG